MSSGTGIFDDRRLFFVGLNTGYVTGGLPDQRCLNFYSLRASPRLHCVIVGNVVVPGGFGSNSVTPTINDDRIWRRLAETIANRGSLPGIQLATAWEEYEGARNFRSREPAAIIAAARSLVAGLRPKDLDRLFTAVQEATDLSIQAGFRHIQLHAAHGYLFSLLVDPAINPNATEVLAALAIWAKNVNARGAESSLRISLRTGYSAIDGGARDEFLDSAADIPATYVDVSSGFYNINKQLIYPARPEVIASRRRETIAFAERHPRRAFIYSGRALQQQTQALPPNLHLGLCRDLIANPDFLDQPSSGCENLGKCHYFSRGAPYLTCGRWQRA